MYVKATSARRHVVLDIETVSLNPDNLEGALSALTGRVVCISVLIDDGTSITEQSLIDFNERHIIYRFWEIVRASDVFIGHNIFGFDLPFIRQRSWILQIRPSRRIDLRRFYSKDLIDTMQLWSNWGATKFVSLDSLGDALGCGGKTGSGTEVADWWKVGNFEAIANYCRDDVRLTFEVFNKLLFRELDSRYQRLKSPTDQKNIRPFALY